MSKHNKKWTHLDKSHLILLDDINDEILDLPTYGLGGCNALVKRSDVIKIFRNHKKKIKDDIKEYEFQIREFCQQNALAALSIANTRASAFLKDED